MALLGSTSSDASCASLGAGMAVEGDIFGIDQLELQQMKADEVVEELEPVFAPAVSLDKPAAWFF